MFKKKRKRSQTTESTTTHKPPSKEVQEALLERNLYDDHGAVVIGNRRDRPRF